MRQLSFACPERDERGATDPILIIAGIAITLILLVGGSFAVSGFIANANDTNAKSDLDRIATAQAAFLAEHDRYGALSVGPGVSTKNTELADSSIGFTPTAGNDALVHTTDQSWAAVTESASGRIFMRSSASATQVDVTSAVGTFSPWAEARQNFVTNPAQVASGSSLERTTAVPNLTVTSVATDGHPSIATATRVTATASIPSSTRPSFKFNGDLDAATPNGGYPVTPGQAYQFAADWKASIGDVRLRYRYHDGTSWIGMAGQTSSANVTDYGSYKTTSFGRYGTTAPAGATHVVVTLEMNRAGGFPRDAWFEYTGLYFGQVDGLNRHYFDESAETSTLRARWLGEPNASARVLEARTLTPGEDSWTATLPADISRSTISEMANRVAG
jgi:hypothetical protein